MSIYKNGKKVTMFNGDYEPAEMYKDGKKICGWVEETFEGRSISSEGTYNDELLLTCKGEHTQKTLNGYNLFDEEKIPTTTQYGTTVTNNNDGSFTISGEKTISAHFNKAFWYSHEETIKLLKAGKISCQKSDVIPAFEFQLRDKPSGTVMNIIASNSALKANYTDTIKQSVLDNGTCVMGICFYDAGNPTVEGTIRPMLWQEGDGTFEPYCGGIPSPNPQYPQEIVSTVPSVDVGGKNLCPVNYACHKLNMDKNVLIGSGVRTDVKPLCNYTLSYDAKVLVENVGVKYRFRFDEYDENNVLLRYGLTEYVSKDGHMVLHWQTLSKTKYVKTVVQYNPTTTNPTWYEFYNIQLEEGNVETPFAPYRTPQQLICDYELYGSDGVYDTLEPCVLVDGEWKCRVTRNWKKVTVDKFSGVFGAYPKAYITWLNLPNSTKGSTESGFKKVFCNNLSFVVSAMSYMNPYEINNENGADTTKCVGLPLTITSKAEADAWAKENPMTIVYPMRESEIELYDPIMLYTNPYATIINGNTEMIATMKTEDYSEAELLSLLSDEYERAIGEL